MANFYAAAPGYCQFQIKLQFVYANNSRMRFDRRFRAKKVFEVGET
jgi:hypothetical protein